MLFNLLKDAILTEWRQKVKVTQNISTNDALCIKIDKEHYKDRFTAILTTGEIYIVNM